MSTLLPRPVVTDDPADLARGNAAVQRALYTLGGHADHALLVESEKALADASTIVAAIIELRERLDLGLLGSDARYDVGTDLYELASKVQSFALGVFNG